MNKRVCSHFAIDRDELEAYAVACVRKTLAYETFAAELEAHLEQVFNHKKTDNTAKESRIQKELQECESGIENLVSTLAGGIQSEAILKKLRELEAKKAELQRDMADCAAEFSRAVEIVDLAAKIRRFSESFDEMFAKADIEGKKELMKIWIREIIVDRDNGVLQVYIREIPAVVPELAGEGANKKGTHEVVSARSSGDPLHFLPTTNLPDILVCAELAF